MILRQFVHQDPTAASYLLGCVGRAAGAVVDPLYPIEPYLDAAAAAGTPIRIVIDSHLHADHRSAGRKLAEAAGAEYALHASAGIGYACRRLSEGERIELGNVVLDVLHTLMLGDVGRTGLASDAASGASTLFFGLRRLQALADYVEIFPGAFAGSVCGRGLSGKPGSTIGFERRHNAAFRIGDADALVEFMLRNIPPAPPRAGELRAWNAGMSSKPAA